MHAPRASDGVASFRRCDLCGSWASRISIGRQGFSTPPHSTEAGVVIHPASSEGSGRTNPDVIHIGVLEVAVVAGRVAEGRPVFFVGLSNSS